MTQCGYEIYDISVGISDKTVTWEGDPVPDVKMVKHLSRGDSSNLSRICIGAHTATHADAPLHFIEKGTTIDAIPLEKFLGPARVVDMTGRKTIRREDLEEELLEGVERVLFATDNSQLWSDPKFHKDFCYIEQDAAEFLVKSGIALVGVDYLSVERPGSKGHPTHKTFLEAGVIILEGCNLAGVPEGDYELVCLPLKVVGMEAAPVRAILRKALEE